MTVAITVLHVLVCFILILVILLQAGRGQGLTGPTFGSGDVDSLFGTRAADFLTKATSVAAICFLLTCIGLDYLEAQKSRSLLEGPRRTAPLDIEQIKKALEKVKQEKQATSTATAVPVATTVVGKTEPPTQTPTANKPPAAKENAKPADTKKT